MTNRQFRVLIKVLLYMLVAIGVRGKDYQNIEREVEEAMSIAESFNP